MQSSITLSSYHYQPIIHMKKDLHTQEVRHLPISSSVFMIFLRIPSLLALSGSFAVIPQTRN